LHVRLLVPRPLANVVPAQDPGNLELVARSFAAVFEQGIFGPWLARHGMTSGPAANVGTFQNFIESAAAQRLILRSMTIYGAPNDRRYAALWHANPIFVKCHVYPAETAASYQTVFNAETLLPGFGLAGYRPAYVALSDDHIVLDRELY
jgi:hypothetical protein